MFSDSTVLQIPANHTGIWIGKLFTPGLMLQMYWGHGIYGIESAAMFYFGKHPNFLDVGESALLAGILPGPGFLNPYTNPKR